MLHGTAPVVNNTVLCTQNSGRSSSFFFFLSLFIFDRERKSMSGGGVERGGDTESEAGSRL